MISPPALDLGSQTVSRDGRHLVYVKVSYDSNIWRLPQGGEPVAVAPSEFAEASPRFSPDGGRIAFVSSRSGGFEIWLSDVSGANTVQLTHSGGEQVTAPDWSPDGKWIAYEWLLKGHEGIYVISSAAGSPRPLATGSSRDSIPRWSRDGRHIYFNSHRTGTQQISRIPAEGGPATQITDDTGSGATQSEDGSLLYYAKVGANGIWARPLKDGLSAGAEFLVIPDVQPEDWGNWALARKGIYLVRRGSRARRTAIDYFDLATRASRTVYTMTALPLLNASSLAISPDERTILFVQVDNDSTSIYGR